MLWFALRPDAPTVPVDDALHRRQSHARSLELVGRVQALKGREKLVRMRHVEAGAVVADVVAVFCAALHLPDLDVGGGALAGEFPGVREQVLEYDLHEREVRIRANLVIDRPFDTPRWFALLEVLGAVSDQVGDADGHAPELCS